MATMPQDLHAKIQVRNLCLPAWRSGSQENMKVLLGLICLMVPLLSLEIEL